MYIDNEGNVAWKVAIGQVCPLHNQKVRNSNDDDQSSSHRPSALCLREKSTIRLHGRNLLQEISMRSKNQKFNFCIQDIRNFLAEAILDTADLDYLNKFVNTYLDCRKIIVQSLPSLHRRCSLTFFHVYI